MLDVRKDFDQQFNNFEEQVTKASFAKNNTLNTTEPDWAKSHVRSDLDKTYEFKDMNIMNSYECGGISQEINSIDNSKD